jgi:hypothetical protein
MNAITMKDLKGEIQKDDNGNILLDVFGKDQQGNFSVKLGSILMGTKPSKEGLEWARKQVEQKYHVHA